MAPSMTMQKVLKDARKHQQAFGSRTWSATFPHETLAQDKPRVTKFTKVRPQPSAYFMDRKTMHKKFEQSNTKLLHKPTTADCEVTALSTTAEAQDKPIKPEPGIQDKPVPECTLQDKRIMPPCISQQQDSTAAIKADTKAAKKSAAKKPAVIKRTTTRLHKPMAEFTPLRRDSHSPLTNLAPTAPMGHKKNNSGIRTPQCIKTSSSAPTSVKGLHLLLAIIPTAHLDLWLEEWNIFCSLFDDHVSVLYSSIEKTLHPAGWQIYADCENKTVADLFKNKIIGRKVLDKKLICRYI